MTTSVEAKLKVLIGELQFQAAFLATKLEEAQARILELEESKVVKLPEKAEAKEK